jgi:hypothetical protein
MIHACQLVKKPELQSVCGLLGNETVAGRDSGGFLVALGELVEHFQITWAITPLYELVSGESVEIGFVLELKGRHEPGADHVGRSCPHCANLLLAMRLIGDWLFPRGGICESCELRTADNFVRGDADGRSESSSVKAFRLASGVGTRCHLGFCHAWCGATLRERLNRIGSAEQEKNLNFTERRESGT